MNTGWIRIRFGRAPFLTLRREWVPVFACGETGMTLQEEPSPYPSAVQLVASWSSRFALVL